LVGEILLGDRIHRGQTTSTGRIWISFFDEGVFGNFGWDDPLGSSGLVVWDSRGNKQYEFQRADWRSDGLRPIWHSCLLDVESDSSTWLYRPLVHLRDQRLGSSWDDGHRRIRIKIATAFHSCPN
jgi:hypothetical protein